jgi:hypothetical protein
MVGSASAAIPWNAALSIHTVFVSLEERTHADFPLIHGQGDQFFFRIELCPIAAIDLHAQHGLSFGVPQTQLDLPRVAPLRW